MFQAARKEVDQEMDRLRRQNEMLNDQVSDLWTSVKRSLSWKILVHEKY